MEIEARSGASKATVVRLAQSLGFRGFWKCGGTHSGCSVPDEDHRDVPLLGEGPREILTAVADQDVRNINQTINQLDPAIFRDVVG